MLEWRLLLLHWPRLLCLSLLTQLLLLLVRLVESLQNELQLALPLRRFCKLPLEERSIG